MTTFKKLFTEHPEAVGMNYARHCLFAFSVMFRLFACGFACAVHAFFPFLFSNTTSTVVRKLNDDFNHRIAE